MLRIRASGALRVLILLGILLGCCHHHDTASAADNCALCALVHVVVVTPPCVDIPTATQVFAGHLPSRPTLPPPSPSVSTIRSRAPPR